MPTKTELKRIAESDKFLAELKIKHKTKDWDGEAARAYFLSLQHDIREKRRSKDPLEFHRFDQKFYSSRNAVIRYIFNAAITEKGFIEILKKAIKNNVIIHTDSIGFYDAEPEQCLKWQMELLNEILLKVKEKKYSFQK
jgi:hypothetical protein